MMKKNLANAETDAQKLPNFSYLIEHMILFDYQGALHLMLSFENKSVQIIDFQTGLSIFEFDFDNHRAMRKADSESKQEDEKDGDKKGYEARRFRSKKNLKSMPSRNSRRTLSESMVNSQPHDIKIETADLTLTRKITDHNQSELDTTLKFGSTLGQSRNEMMKRQRSAPMRPNTAVD